MYKEHQGATSLDAVVSDNTDVKSRVTVSASEKNGKLLVTLANYAFEDTEIELDILGASTAKKANVQTLRCDDIRACNTFENPERIAPVSADIDLTSPLVLPAASVVAITVDLL
jgi:alpha-L-arabinofuranosidase